MATPFVNPLAPANAQLPSVDALVAKLEYSKEWLTNEPTNAEGFLNFVAQVFEDCTVAFASLSANTGNSPANEEAERLASAIVDAWSRWGVLFPDHVDSFGRDVFNVGEYHVEAAQFFQPVDFYPGDDKITKHFRWSVYDASGQVIYRYYLESSKWTASNKFYTLGLMLEHGHNQVQPYGSKMPTYAQMKKRVVAHMLGHGNESVIGLKF